jgi:beta-glucosidase/6-phospho-beta-glucosidase/beta-galactosidase
METEEQNIEDEYRINFLDEKSAEIGKSVEIGLGISDQKKEGKKE